MGLSYDLIESLCGTQTGWASANDQDIDVAVEVSTPRTFFVNILNCGSGLHLLPIGLADLPLVSHCVDLILLPNKRKAEWVWEAEEGREKVASVVDRRVSFVKRFRVHKISQPQPQT